MTDEHSTHPHLEGLIRAVLNLQPRTHANDSTRLWQLFESAEAAENEVRQALDALPGGGVDELAYKPEQVSDAKWSRCLALATAFMPGARDAWTRFTDKPWNKHAMHRVLAEFAAALPTPSPHEADRNDV